MVSRYNYFVKDEVSGKLLDINRDFYQTLGPQFSETRQRLQPGVQKLLKTIPEDAAILDIGCGNGTLWEILAENGYHGIYVGIDNSLPLIQIARSRIMDFKANQKKSIKKDNLIPDPHFIQADITDSKWVAQIERGEFSYVFAFSLLHHIPGVKLRKKLLSHIHALLNSTGNFFHSEWQFLNSERLRSRIIPWDQIGIDDSDLDNHDYLLDWKSGGYGIRYVHHFGLNELSELARQTGFNIRETFLSDGDGSNLGLYQVWQK